MAHPTVRWYFQHIHPPIISYIKGCLALANENPDQNELRQAEMVVLNSMQDWLVYVLDPSIYDQLTFLDGKILHS